MGNNQDFQSYHSPHEWLLPYVAAGLLNVSTQTLEAYEKSGLIHPKEVKRTPGGRGQRRYLCAGIEAILNGRRLVNSNGMDAEEEGFGSNEGETTLGISAITAIAEKSLIPGTDATRLILGRSGPASVRIADSRFCLHSSSESM